MNCGSKKRTASSEILVPSFIVCSSNSAEMFGVHAEPSCRPSPRSERGWKQVAILSIILVQLHKVTWVTASVSSTRVGRGYAQIGNQLSRITEDHPIIL